ncbi:hypothetical protein BT96DRAFT_1008992 [Gymnopus androsaceus JB14]|uniref:DNA2/NAM7 helicase helicase domain-containing protein n=1 Tax=Gymnopus androsaceus JB14 TaxID=1447944 RepID=A0A6A4GDT8_9AGAR|nr:hypothetical protein BT96DRAFT_1008992 [Gymnopus androsaceus JB14]
MSGVVGSSRIMLSTLGLLSNPALAENGTFDIVPVEHLVMDEASQINDFEHMRISHKFRKSLQKVCFFGDPKQYIANKITVLSDPSSGIILEYDGFVASQIFRKEAVFDIYFTFSFNGSASEDLDFYALATSPSGH